MGLYFTLCDNVLIFDNILHILKALVSVYESVVMCCNNVDYILDIGLLVSWNHPEYLSVHCVSA